VIYERVLESEKKVVVIRLNHQSHGTHLTTIQEMVETLTSKGINFKKNKVKK